MCVCERERDNLLISILLSDESIKKSYCFTIKIQNLSQNLV